MSQFDYPRIHVRGLISFNVGTGNNDDYGDRTILPPGNARDGGRGDPDLIPYADTPLRLADTDRVQPITYGKSDIAFERWAGRKLTVKRGGQREELIPAAWNYHGDMGVSMWFDEGSAGEPVTGRVVVASVQLDPRRFVMSLDDLKGWVESDCAIVQPCLGARLSYKKRPDEKASTAMSVDCSQEGGHQSSQIFADNLMLEGQGTVLLGRKLGASGDYVGGGQPSKASACWLNFGRNLNLRGPGGGAATFQTVLRFDDGLEHEALKVLFERFRPAGETRAIQGLVFRSALFRVEAKYREDLNKLVELFEAGKINPGIGEIVGTLAPWYEGDEAESLTLGRVLYPRSYSWQLRRRPHGPSDVPPPPGTFPKPRGDRGNLEFFRLAPLVARVDMDLGVISLDVVSTFPERYEGDTSGTVFEGVYDDDTDPDRTRNPKYDLGPIALYLEIPEVGADGAATSRRVKLATLGFDERTPADGHYGTRAYCTRGGMIDVALSGQGHTREDLENGTLSIEAMIDGQPAELLREAELMVVAGRSTLYAEQTPGGVASTFNFNGAEVPSTPVGGDRSGEGRAHRGGGASAALPPGGAGHRPSPRRRSRKPGRRPALIVTIRPRAPAVLVVCAGGQLLASKILRVAGRTTGAEVAAPRDQGLAAVGAARS